MAVHLLRTGFTVLLQSIACSTRTCICLMSPLGTCCGVMVRHDMQVLHVAILVKNEAAVQALLDFGISSDCRNARRWTALDEAIATRHRSITKLLYAHAHASKKARMKEKKMQLMATCNELPNYSVKVSDQN